MARRTRYLEIDADKILGLFRETGWHVRNGRGTDVILTRGTEHVTLSVQKGHLNRYTLQAVKKHLGLSLHQLLEVRRGGKQRLGRAAIGRRLELAKRLVDAGVSPASAETMLALRTLRTRGLRGEWLATLSVSQMLDRLFPEAPSLVAPEPAEPLVPEKPVPVTDYDALLQLIGEALELMRAASRQGDYRALYSVSQDRLRRAKEALQRTHHDIEQVLKQLE
jgi:hypothetical protein